MSNDPAPNDNEDNEDGADAPSLDALSAERRKKRDELAAEGVDVYPVRYRPVGHRGRDAGALRRSRARRQDRRVGREWPAGSSAIRGHGKLSFATLTDVTGSIQLIMQVSVLSDRSKEVLSHLDLGDWVGAEGEVITSRRGELSVDVAELTLLSKALRPPPDKWHGLSSTDTRYRQREVDLMANPESRRTFDIRFKTVVVIATGARRGAVRRGRHAHPATAGRRGPGPAILDPLQRARHRPQPAHRP